MMDDEHDSSQRSSWFRLGLLMTGLFGFAAFSHAMGWTDGMTPESIRAWILAAGAWGALVYIGAFAAGNLMQVPGMWFIVAGMLVYGPFEGALLSAVAAMLAVTTSFAVVRVVGGKPLGTVKNRWVKRALDGLRDRPVFSIAAMRLVMVTSPPLNYLLAMSDIRPRDYVVGSAVGLVVPIAVTAASIELGLEAIEGFGILPV
jgi:uncharacterized membrane protein YdjX (TVP38/TMEM64 family)